MKSATVSSELDAQLPALALQLARLFVGGGRLVAIAPGRIDHARHVAVEFVHPAVAGARSLPAIAVDVHEVAATVAPGDALVVIDGPAVGNAALTESAVLPDAALTIRLPADLSEPDIVRWYHVLWELVQVSLNHPGLTGEQATSAGDSTGFLYPFLDAAEVDTDALLASMAESAEAKRAESHALADQSIAANSDVIGAAVDAAISSVANGGRVVAIGNGGSACDAAQAVRFLTASGIAALSLASDPAILTALANDLGAEHIFSRQLEASLTAADVLLIFSTSGSSPNLLRAIEVAYRVGAPVITCSGYGGGPMAAHHGTTHALCIDSTSVHRIQEAQGAMIQEIATRLTASRTRMEALT